MLNVNNCYPSMQMKVQLHECCDSNTDIRPQYSIKTQNVTKTIIASILLHHTAILAALSDIPNHTQRHQLINKITTVIQKYDYQSSQHHTSHTCCSAASSSSYTILRRAFSSSNDIDSSKASMKS